jgi:hypothetical protein
MVHINLILWLAMVGATVAPGMPGQMPIWTALVGLFVAASWEHSAVRGALTPKKAANP